MTDQQQSNEYAREIIQAGRQLPHQYAGDVVAMQIAKLQDVWRNTIASVDGDWRDGV